MHSGQAQKEVFVNEALARLDALAQPIITATLASPPATHAAGDTFLVTDPAGEEWTGQESSLAISQGTHWAFQAPYEGMRIFDRQQGTIRIWRDGWSVSQSIAEPSGGATVDIEARGAIATLLGSLRTLGILPLN